MDLISLLVVLLVAGFFVWLVQNFAPVDARFKQVAVFVVIIFVVIWFIRALGVNLAI